MAKTVSVLIGSNWYDGILLDTLTDPSTGHISYRIKTKLGTHLYWRHEVNL